ncbi:hypothetical protein AMS68_003165 [Peltaster fructicola]|uniref:Uncharacterized protein n=1 Tax=Peltaster fructicola TaxID=286661 RepID=A0A6H0XSQ6_9PEZI|nr:hypothetical protein AMS68_003165 [Peltaster fructicola]
MVDPAPVVTLNTAQADQYFASSHYATTAAGQSPGALSNPFTPNASIPPTPGSLAGRKRSRGDIFAGDDEIEPDGSLPTPAEEPPAVQDEPMMGEGMALSYSLQAGNTAENQSAMERDGVRPTFQLKHASRPSMSSRKSQRRDTGASGTDDLAHLVLPSNMRDATQEPLIDEATRVLGISWTRMDSSEILLINQAAYNKFIQNHYPALKEVKVWFENSALPGYLVVATNAYTGGKEYYIFSHDLLEARLVSREASEVIPRLRLLPALELAAPAGHLTAETDSATTSQNEVNVVLEQAANGDKELRGRTCEPEHARDHSVESTQHSGGPLCSAHAMELD